MTHLNLLGPFSATGLAGPVAFEARTAAAVVARIALARGRPVPRDAVAEALWPDHDLLGARTNLRKALQRVRKAAPGLLVEDDGLRLEGAETDLDRADRLHRTYLLATRQPEGTEALAKEWEIRKKTLLEGWSDEWITPHRERADVHANDLGADLARAHEAMGDLFAALAVWRDVLARVPHHAQALQSALRLESAVHGPARAAELARSAETHFRDELGIAMPSDLRRAVRDFGLGAMEPVPPPESIRKRSELYLLAHMFESNLAANRVSALNLLAEECTVAKSLAHPRAMLSLLTLALEKTEGGAPERIKVATIAATLASWTSEFEIGHRWCDAVIALTPRDDLRHSAMLGLKGFMIGEQGDFATSRDLLAEATRLIERTDQGDEALRAVARAAGPHWHLLDFPTSIGMYESVIERALDRTDTIGKGILAVGHGNLCFVYSVMARWSDAIRHGEATLRTVDEHPTYGWIVVAPLGLARFETGDRAEGARLIRRSLANTQREGMPRFNQICLDYAAVALARAGRDHAARCLLDANIPHQAALRRSRSLAEAQLVEKVAGIDSVAPYVGENPLRGQSASTLSEWACEELDRLARDEAVKPPP